MKILARGTGLLFFRVENTHLNEHNYMFKKIYRRNHYERMV